MGKRSTQAAVAIFMSCAAALLPGCASRAEYLDFQNLRGDAKVVERKQGDEYPKYWVLLPEIPIDRSGTYKFHLSGLPKSEYWMGLTTGTGFGSADRELIRAHDVRCDVEIEGRLDDFVIHLVGELEGDHWSPSVGWSTANPRWVDGSPRCTYCPHEMGATRKFRPNPAIEYEVRIHVTTRDDLAWTGVGGSRSLTPVLWAGGYWGGLFDSL